MPPYEFLFVRISDRRVLYSLTAHPDSPKLPPNDVLARLAEHRPYEIYRDGVLVGIAYDPTVSPEIEWFGVA